MGGRGRVGKGRGAKKGKNSKFNPSTSNVTPDRAQQLETQVNHNKCVYLTKWLHECAAEGGDCGGSAAGYWVHKSTGVIVAFLFTVD